MVLSISFYGDWYLAGFNKFWVYFYVLKGMMLLLQWFVSIPRSGAKHGAFKGKSLSKKILANISKP